jgi:hypothetical protein
LRVIAILLVLAHTSVGEFVPPNVVTVAGIELGRGDLRDLEGRCRPAVEVVREHPSRLDGWSIWQVEKGASVIQMYWTKGNRGRKVLQWVEHTYNHPRGHKLHTRGGQTLAMRDLGLLGQFELGGNLEEFDKILTSSVIIQPDGSSYVERDWTSKGRSLSFSIGIAGERGRASAVTIHSWPLQRGVGRL